MLRTFALVVSVALGVTGCARSAQESTRPDAVEAAGADQGSPAPEGETASESQPPEEDAGDDGGGGGSGTQEDGSKDDLQVFAYATSDEAELAAELAAIAEVLARLESDLQSRDLDAAQADAGALLDQAETLEADAGAARHRQQPLEPSDAQLVDAREAALDAFGLTEDYAAAVTSVAEAALAMDLPELASVLQDAVGLAGTSDDLTQAYADLNAALTSWAEGNPAEAAAALAKYA